MAVLNPTPDVIRFQYELDTIFDKVSIKTLDHASNMIDQTTNEEMVDRYALVDEERDRFNEYFEDASIRVFQKIVKMTLGIPDSYKLIGTEAVKQKETITFTGTGGLCNISGSGGISHTLTLGGDNEDIPAAINAYVSDNYTEYNDHGIQIYKGTGNTMIFESNQAGIPFVAPVLSFYGGDISGSVAHTTANSEGSLIAKTLSFDIKNKESYNANNLPIIDKEISKSFVNYVLKEWFMNVNLTDLSSLYLSKFNENMRLVVRYSISLRRQAVR